MRELFLHILIYVIRDFYMLKINAFLFFICLFFIFLPNVTVNAQAPDWIRDPYRKYDRQLYVAAVGIGNSHQTADKDALGKLVAIFGQSIQVDERISTSYQEAMGSGAVAAWSERTSANSTISTSAGMDSLVGAEITDRWDNGRDFYVIAVLNKRTAAAVYADMIKANQATISNLTNLSAAEKNSFDGYARYQLAAVIADITISYGNVLNFIGVQGASAGLRPGNDYRMEAQNIVKAIPIGIAVRNDKSARIQGAFAKAISELGFRSGGTNSRYVLNVNIVITPTEHPTNANKFARMELEANLVDTSVNSVLFPYNFANREGHNTLSEAENRVFMAAERQINQDYKNLLSNYLSLLMPKR